MARLHEYQGKAVLAKGGVAIPRGRAAATSDEARAIAQELGGPVVIKIQSWSTGRAAIGGVQFADTPAQAAMHAAQLLAMKVGNFLIAHVLVEERLAFVHELFVSLSIDDRARAPVILLAAGGGSGIEERAASVQRIACDVRSGPDAQQLGAAVETLAIPAAAKPAVGEALRRVFDIARANEARSLEINPLVIGKDGRVIAADCRMTIDDYAVVRHPALGIDIARELDHPPTELERIAYQVEQEDHRGTFFFAQMNVLGGPAQLGGSGPPGPTLAAWPGSESRPTQTQSKGLIGFHGAGGGGSMMSMDAITAQGFTIANFCDTSGNPSPAKVYRAARIILAQPGLIGYFGSGSGVANQEQYWSAYGLAKAFWEMNLDIPAVIRLGGNTEDRAVDILQSSCRAANLPAVVEGYKKTDSPAKVAARFAELVQNSPSQREGAGGWVPRSPRRPDFVGSKSSMQFPVKGGRLWINTQTWNSNAAAIIARSNGLLKDDHGKPALTIDAEAFKTKDSDMIACEVECRRDGVEGVFVELDVSALDALVAAASKGGR